MLYRFDDFRIDGRTRRLLQGDVEIHLSPKAFELLCLLVRNRDRAVAKRELQQTLWPATYVLETNLASLVAEIRQALGDSAVQSRYVRTVSRFGYWFIGAVVQAESRSAPGTPPLRYWLIWETRQVPLSEGDNIIGRAPDVSVWIEASGVSRRHACIRLDGARATLEDLASKNGTYLRGVRVTDRVPLADGDQIRLGSVLMTFRVPPPAGSTSTAGEKR